MLKRRDAAIIKLLDMAGHVVLYQFNEDSKAWDRKGVEGSLFVVERSTEPRYQFVVLNRLSSENLIETVDADFQTELTDQFLLYRNLKQEILGVWFYSPPERTAISDLLGTLTGDLEQAAEPPPAEPEPVYAAPPPVVAPTAPMAAAAPLGSPPAANVANFFNMAAMSQQAAPPMPAGAVVASPSMPPLPLPLPTAAATPSAVAPVPPAVDMDKLKGKLAGQLRGLLDDDGFLTLLANEYLRQQQRALQQAQQARQRKEAATTSASTPTDAVTASLPAHLASLMQSACLK